MRTLRWRRTPRRRRSRFYRLNPRLCLLVGPDSGAICESGTSGGFAPWPTSSASEGTGVVTAMLCHVN